MELVLPPKPLLVLDKNLGRLRRVSYRIWMKITGNTRPSSYPYLTGDSFRALADHIYDETGTFEPETIQRGDIVFVSNLLMRTYLEKVHPRATQPYILIQHNGDFSVDKEIADLLDENIIRFYAQDVTYEHEKIIPIPIGIENRFYQVNGVISMYNRFRRSIKARPPVRKNRIFFRFSLETNPGERGPARELFLRQPLMDTVSIHLSSKMHAEVLMTYKFVASPRGNSIESCRTWEALYLGTVPIVKDYVAMKYFASFGLPLWIVQDWHELEGLTEEMLSAKYDFFIKNAQWEALFMDFWIQKIRSDQAAARDTIQRL